MKIFIKFPDDNNQRVKKLQKELETSSLPIIFSVLLEKYFAAEKIIGLETALGERLRNRENGLSLAFLNNFHELISGWFRREHEADLHPLFPTIIEEMGFSSDEERIEQLWNSFLKLKLEEVITEFPQLIKILLELGLSQNLNKDEKLYLESKETLEMILYKKILPPETKN